MNEGTKPKVTLEEMVSCAERELAMRRRVYPRWVDSGKMSPGKADEETIRMEAIVAVLRGLLRTAKLANHMSSEDLPFQVDLFDLLDDGKDKKHGT